MPEKIIDPLSEKANNKYVNNFRMFKIRGCFETLEEASKYGIMLRDTIEPYVNVYITEVGHWTPFYDDNDYAKDVIYQEEQLNDLMRLHKEGIEKSKNYIN